MSNVHVGRQERQVIYAFADQVARWVAVEKAAAALLEKIEHAGSNMAEWEVEDLRKALRSDE